MKKKNPGEWTREDLLSSLSASQYPDEDDPFRLYWADFDFSGADLSSWDLRGYTFDNSIFYCTDLTRAKMQNASLRGADLSKAILQYTRLDFADLYRANLRGADMYRVHLRGADLRQANLRDADLRYADLRDADLRSADVTHADLRYAWLRGANLIGVFLSDAITGKRKHI